MGGDATPLATPSACRGHRRFGGRRRRARRAAVGVPGITGGAPDRPGHAVVRPPRLPRAAAERRGGGSDGDGGGRHGDGVCHCGGRPAVAVAVAAIAAVAVWGGGNGGRRRATAPPTVTGCPLPIPPPARPPPAHNHGWRPRRRTPSLSIQPAATSADGGKGGGGQGAAERGGSWGEFGLLGGAHLGVCRTAVGCSSARGRLQGCHYRRRRNSKAMRTYIHIRNRTREERNTACIHLFINQVITKAIRRRPSVFLD